MGLTVQGVLMIKKLFLTILFILLYCSFAFGATTWTTDVTSAGGGGACENAGECSQSEFEALSGDYSDSVFSFSGTFTSQLDVNISGTSGHPVILDGYATNDTTYMNLSEASGRALIDTAKSGNGIDISGQSHITIQDFEITNTGIGTGDEAIYLWECYNITIKRNYIYECREGIYLSGDYHVVGGSSGHGNVLKNIGWTTADADIVTYAAEQCIVSYNHLYADSSLWGVDGVTLAGGGSSHFLIENNSIHGHNNTSGDGGEDGIDIKFAAHDVIIRYNSIYDNAVSGVNLSNGSHNNIYVYGNYIYSNSENLYAQNRSGTSPNYTYYDHYNIYWFSNIIKDADSYGMHVPSSGASENGFQIFNNTVITNGTSPSSSAKTGIYVSASDQVFVKNNIFYKGRPNESDYIQVYIGAYSDDNTTFDYNWYYWPAQTSKIYWGDAGNLTVDQIQAGSSNGLPQEGSIAANESDPGLTDIAGGDYTIAASAAVIGVGVDMGTGAIATVTIDGVGYPVYWDVALGPSTVWSSGSTLPVIDVVYRDVVGWDIGAYAFDLVVSNVSPADDAIGVSITASATWDSNYANDDVFLKIGACPASCDTSVSNDDADNTYDMSTLVVSTTYCLGFKADGGAGDCQEFDFTTAAGPPADPSILRNIVHSDAAGDLLTR